MIQIYRWYHDDCTIGRLTYTNTPNKPFQCWTLELPELNNEKNISCIPEGSYTGRVGFSSKNGRCIKIEQVPNRRFIQIHKGNYTFDKGKRKLEGCILVGDSIKFLNKDSIPDVTNSKATLEELMSLIRLEETVAIF